MSYPGKKFWQTYLFLILFLYFFDCPDNHSFSYAATDVTSYNFTKKDPPKVSDTAKSSASHNIRAISPDPINKEVVPRLAQLHKESIYQSKAIQKIFADRAALYEDAEVISYINSVAGRLMAGSNVKVGSDITFRLIRDPAVNAFAFVDGSIYIHTGALARIENEAQLAYLLGHEISHALNKDVVYHKEDFYNKTIVYKIVDVALAPSSVFFGILADSAKFGSNLLYETSVKGYSRDVETRADKEGILWAARTGYDPNEASSMIKIFMNEQEKYSRGIEIFFLMSHPSNKFRLASLQKLIHDTYGQESGQGDVRSGEFLKNMTKIKLYNASLNIRLERLEHARDNIVWVLETYPDNAEALYLNGEIYRLGAENPRTFRYELNSKNWQELDKRFQKEGLKEEWINKAKASYQKDIERNPAYANSYKGFGLLYTAQKDKQAVSYLQKYLELCPNAYDKRYVNEVMKKMAI